MVANAIGHGSSGTTLRAGIVQRIGLTYPWFGNGFKPRHSTRGPLRFGGVIDCHSGHRPFDHHQRA